MTPIDAPDPKVDVAAVNPWMGAGSGGRGRPRLGSDVIDATKLKTS